MANQHTSPLVGVERRWAEAVAAGLGSEVRHALAPHAKRAMLRSITAWLEHDAVYDYATPAAIMAWRRVLVAAGEPPKGPARRRKPPIMYLRAGRRRAA